MRATKRKVAPMLPLLDFAAPAKPQPAPQPEGDEPEGDEGEEETQSMTLSEACHNASSTAYPD